MAADFAVTGARTVIAVQSDPRLARYLATTEENRTAIYGARDFAGLGGYGFAYSLAAILLLLLFYVLRAKRQRPTISLIIAGGLVVLFEMGFTTAIVLTLALGFIFLVQDLIKVIAFRMFIYASAVFGLIIGLYSSLLNAAAESPLVSDDVSQRFSELALYLSGESSNGSDLGTRLDRWRESIDIVLSSGPLGLAGKTAVKGDTGGHSEWLDLLASYGVLAMLVALFFVFAWRALRDNTSASEISSLVRPWTFFVVLGFVNTLLFSTIVVTWMFFLPALANWLRQQSTDRTTEVSLEVRA